MVLWREPGERKHTRRDHLIKPPGDATAYFERILNQNHEVEAHPKDNIRKPTSLIPPYDEANRLIVLMGAVIQRKRRCVGMLRKSIALSK